MLKNKDQKAAARNVFMSSIQGLANVLAVIVTFLATPLIYGQSIDWIQRFTASNYGLGFEGLVAFVWFTVTAAFVFFIARASASTALVMGGIALATRLI